MSNNSFSSYVPASVRRQLAAWEEVEAMSLADLADFAAEEARPAPWPRPGRYVSAAGLAALIEPAMEEFTAATGGDYWPHNFLRSQSGSVGRVGPYGRRLDRDDADEEIIRFARLGGWIRAAAKLPGIRRTLKKGMTVRGINSPYCHFTPWDLFQAFPAPGKLEKLLWATRARATAILAAYKGQKPSWVHVTQALLVERRVGKAAIIAVARTLGWEGIPTYIRAGQYRAARGWLTRLHMAVEYAPAVSDIADGHLTVRIDRSVWYEEGDYRVYPAFAFRDYRWVEGRVVERGSARYFGISETPEGVILQAKREWSAARRIEKACYLGRGKVVVTDDPVPLRVNTWRNRGCRSFPDTTWEECRASGDYSRVPVPGTDYSRWEGSRLHEGVTYEVSGGEVILVYFRDWNGYHHLSRVVVRSGIGLVKACEMIASLQKETGFRY